MPCDKKKFQIQVILPQGIITSSPVTLQLRLLSCGGGVAAHRPFKALLTKWIDNAQPLTRVNYQGKTDKFGIFELEIGVDVPALNLFCLEVDVFEKVPKQAQCCSTKHEPCDPAKFDVCCGQASTLFALETIGD